MSDISSNQPNFMNPFRHNYSILLLLTGDENKAYESSPDEPRTRKKTSRKDEDMYDSIFDLRQCDSYDVVQKRGPFRRLRSVCRRIAESRHFIHFIMLSILVNMICMGLEHYNQVCGTYVW